MMRNYLTEIEPNQTNANSALKVLYIELLGLPIHNEGRLCDLHLLWQTWN